MTALDLSGLPARRSQLLEYGKVKVHHLPDWSGYDDPRKLEVIRYLAMQRGRDPRIAKLATTILKRAGCQPREYRKQAAALLAWVQDPQNIYYVNEPGERLQDPIYTIQNKLGDCDDTVIVLCTLFESIRLPWKLVISGRYRSSHEKARYIEGERYPQDVQWSHIYCMVGTPPFNPKEWYFCETTVQGVPLGWDVVDGDPRYIPEMDVPKSGPARVMQLPPYEESLSGIADSVGSALAEDEESEKQFAVPKWVSAVAMGVAVSATTQVVLDWVRGQGVFAGEDNGFKKIRSTLSSFGIVR